MPIDVLLLMNEFITTIGDLTAEMPADTAKHLAAEYLEAHSDGHTISLSIYSHGADKGVRLHANDAFGQTVAQFTASAPPHDDELHAIELTF